MAECRFGIYWASLPRGIKEYFEKNADSEAIPFIICFIEYFLEQDYDWDLLRALKATYTLAADFLLKGKDGQAFLILFCSALLREFLSRGYMAVRDLISGMWKYKDDNLRIMGENADMIEISGDLFFSEFNYLRHAAEYTRSRLSMIVHFYDRLQSSDIDTRHLHQLREREKKDPLGPLHTMNASDTVAKPLMMITINWSDQSVNLWVYGDTKLKWIFQYCFGSGRKKKLMKGIAVPREPCLCLVDGGKDDIHWAERKRFYLASSGNQTLAELGIGHKSTYGIYQCMSIQVRRDFNPNLYKAHQLLSRRKGIITLDLHGCTRDKARCILKESLRLWVDTAMRGEYPFVIAVDIICGGGKQVISELVAQFIHDNSQVANRPKGTY